jgi:hypothetical protein
MATTEHHAYRSWGRWILLSGAIVAFAGYFAPWVNHPAAGLAILGIDLGEYVKFLIPVRSGEIPIWREGFYLPLLTISLALSLFAFRPECRYPLWVRISMLLLAAVSALNMLPPAWTPALLRTPEFRLQSLWILLSLVAIGVSPLLALLPRWFASAAVALLSLTSMLLTVRMFLAVLPAIEPLYNHALSPATGVWATTAGLLLLAAGAILIALPVTNLPKALVKPAVS